LTIGEALYQLSEIEFTYENGQGGRLWLVRKPDGTEYQITLNRDGDLCCDCPDATFRHRETTCKHVSALKAALEQLDREERLACWLTVARAEWESSITGPAA
jgi:hypothetical protein